MIVALSHLIDAGVSILAVMESEGPVRHHGWAADYLGVLLQRIGVTR